MLEAKNANPKNSTSSSSPIVIAFKPRQVLLAEAKSKMTATAQKLEPTKKVLLHHAILRYLERNTFSKTLKRFVSEAQIENDDWKASSLDLEEIYCKYMDACLTDAKQKTSKELESGGSGTSRKDVDSDCVTTKEVTKKKKKKSSNESGNDAVIDQSKAIDKNPLETAKSTGNILADSTITESGAKPVEKKKKKKGLGSSDQTEQVKSDVLNKPVDDPANEVDIADLPKNTKDKSKGKKKKDKVETEEFQSSPDATREEKKSSKKRKRLASDEKEEQTTKVTTVEETKRRKTEGPKEVENELDSAQVDYNQSNLSTKQLNGNGNGNSKLNAGEKSDIKKPGKNQLNGSAEPKTINAFQRVKIDEVEFADDKLQDNSYWAKSGAEVGYGAKAQEVLGQVRGRDFRHEKTKKKRGSYRGGQIDLQSHSVKFNYSDED